MNLYPTTILADSPLAYFRLGELTGTSAADSSGNSNTGAYTGGFSLGRAGAVAGENDPAAAFDGTGYVASSLTRSSPLSVEAWVNPASFAAVESCILGGIFTIYTANKFTVGGANNLTTFIVPAGQWSHLAATWDGTTILAYANGALVATITGDTLDYTTGGAGFRIGGRVDVSGNPSYSFIGAIDEVAIYPAVLSATRILAHYNAGIVQAAARPVIRPRGARNA
ncbi:MAG TPA: LamG domain-containing protein [Tepidisphaeraceae bacterium]|jgi:hypothetical protein|nr:LamG domain-containing protein [Tepidisphaeraceae bacterium]